MKIDKKKMKIDKENDLPAVLRISFNCLSSISPTASISFINGHSFKSLNVIKSLPFAKVAKVSSMSISKYSPSLIFVKLKNIWKIIEILWKYLNFFFLKMWIISKKEKQVRKKERKKRGDFRHEKGA